jgi:hypothetical protein
MGGTRYCARCGRPLASGRTWYEVTIDLRAGFDGVLEEGAQDGLSAALRSAQDKTEEELMDEVVRKLGFALCKPCRDEWVQDPLGGSAAPSGPDPRRLH